MRIGCTLIFLFLINGIYSQAVYKTPSGKKYHLSTCRMVENVSSELLSVQAIQDYGLEPCKICHPPYPNNLSFHEFTPSKAVGVSQSVRCKGVTKKGTRCRHTTRLGNGFCFQHTDQNTSNIYIQDDLSYSHKSNRCGSKTKKGTPCKRIVKGGGKCYQHE